MALQDILGAAATIGKSLIRSSRAVDVVAITGGGFVPLFPLARPLVASVYEIADLMEHPLETGAVIADHIVFHPVEIDLPVVCVGETAYRSTYAAIRATYLAGTILTITTRTGSYPNMVITEIPHDESPDAYDAVRMDIRLREAHFVSPASGGLTQSQTKNASQSSTVQRGTQQTTATGTAKGATAASQYQNSGAGPTPQGSTLYRWAYQ